MKKADSYNWILRIVDNNGERYELKLDYTLSNMRKLGVVFVHVLVLYLFIPLSSLRIFNCSM